MNAVVESYAAAKGTHALVELKGSGNRDISLALNRVPKDVNEVVFTEGATEAVVNKRI